MPGIILHEPEIPYNTGNIGRTCLNAGASLHLIEPLGFHLSNKFIKRAGLDYWDRLDVSIYDNYEDFIAKFNAGFCTFCTGSASGSDFDSDFASASDSDSTSDSCSDSGIGSYCQSSQSTIWYATTKARRLYSEVVYSPNDFIMFGKESGGIPEEILTGHEEHCIRIPMMPEGRSLNLCNSVSIILYELLRQNGFPGLVKSGNLHRLSWK